MGQDRASRLESALQTASVELKQRIDSAERWEFKAGDQQQQIKDLERIRKALTSQLHQVRSDVAPKEQKLIQMQELLKEGNREYDSSLEALSEKDQQLKDHVAKLAVLQKQVCIIMWFPAYV